jgi:hypothetical protein
MSERAVKILLYAVPALIVLVFVVWMEVDPYNLAPMTHEDMWIENGTAIGYGVGGLFFFLAAWRAPQLKNGARSWAKVMTLAWALIGIFLAGEEISWGQRIFGIATPEVIAEDSTQDEINIHNLTFIEDNSDLSEYRMLSIYMVLGGLGIPLIARVKLGKQLVGRAYFPVVPWCYSVLWVGAYVYGKYYRNWMPIPDLHPENASTEIRELLVALGTAFFAMHAFWRPSDVYIGEAPPKRVASAEPAASQAE